ncbi:MAG: energy-coupling factor transporter transmembrane component T family protein [Nocardioides sp.]
MIGDYRPGTTWMHQLPAGTKLVALFAIGIATLVVRGPLASMAALAVAIVLLIWSTGPTSFLGTVLRSLRGLLVMVALLFAWQAWQSGWPRAVETVGDILALALLATVLTVTTRVDDLLEAITTGLRPLRRVGLDADRVALTFALTIRAIPATLELAEETRRAAQARGLERDPRARLTPFVIRVVARAHDTGAALHARGVGD